MFYITKLTISSTFLLFWYKKLEQTQKNDMILDFYIDKLDKKIKIIRFWTSNRIQKITKLMILLLFYTWIFKKS